MNSKKRMPTVMLLLVVSWMFAFFGLFASAYIMIYRITEQNSVVLSCLVLLVAFFLSGVSRMLANIGQALFDSRLFISEDMRTVIERITVIEQRSGEGLQAIRESGRNQAQAIQSLPGELAVIEREEGEALRKSISEAALGISESLKAIRESIAALSKSMAEQHKDISEGQKKELQHICNNLETVKNAIEETGRCSREDLRDTRASLEIIKNFIEQIGCDSKDISQNIHQVKSFFEQIEKHLDLKK